ncbi:NADPH-dependent 2,4-dienoyl-CoA reductase/sulfur reductase-like enzyme [Haloactinopolyspora alba]|uniref:NADPH-dependent 2,4-dienoyl-CoA reductase/sulfur reductase-like enzyme n=1 Tax=Haloactinopolyspora alba TaxID=648780 RepID=A0A2P8DHJ7_9ACTN|nr:NAD(P)/FAD-dependent oxidoreductase [Haloactinopolyspora alba]PSK96649.1 NADPH-dependent 2,4-dienoyl-CoA reductase/sulfur reductase-like enzyme [Haloactinopolyspora alba]
MTTSTYDLAVVGAGPAGMAAAAAAGDAGCRVALVDAAERPGGQFWRHPPGGIDHVRDLHHDVRTFRRLHARVRGTVEHLPGHQVWTVTREDDAFGLHTVRDGAEVVFRARALVLAPGAYDRQLPFPGWDLPGVYTAGGAQALLKEHQVTVGRRVVVGGTGPFLLPVAAGLAERGVNVSGVFEANSPGEWLRRGAGAVPVVRSPRKLAEGAGYAAALARHRIPYRPRHAVVAAHGTDEVTAVTVARLDRSWNELAGSRRRIRCDAVAVGWGFVPRLELPAALGCRTRVDVDGSAVVDVDGLQRSSVPDVYVAGEATGVGGAQWAAVTGEIAGRAAAVRLGFPSSFPASAMRRRRHLRAFATAMHAAHPVRDGWRDRLSDDTVVCRCEEVTAGAVTRAASELGGTDVRSVKLLTRAGMGWCQGRICGDATAGLTAAAAGVDVDPRGHLERPVAVPVPLGTLAADPADASPRDVDVT